MERTINGKTLDKVMEEFLKYFPDEAVETLYGYPYISIEWFRGRMDEVVGPFNYDFEVTQTCYSRVDERNRVVSCIGTLSIKDDAGAVVARKSAQGGATITLSSDEGKAIKPKNDITNATHEAFKSCCRMYGIAEKQIREKREALEMEQKNKKTQGAKSAEPKTTKKDDASYRVEIRGKYQDIRKKSGQHIGYKVPVVDLSTGSAFMLVLYDDGAVKAIEEHGVPIKEFKRLYTEGKRISVVGYESRRNDGEEQLIMKKPVTKEAS